MGSASPLTLDQARAGLEASLAKAAELGIAVSIVVVDRRGDLLTAARMDGVAFFSSEIAHGKAMAAAATGMTSAALEEHAGNAVLVRVAQLTNGRMIYSRGAVPILRDGAPVGGIGVSGAAPEQDEIVAEAGASIAG